MGKTNRQIEIECTLNWLAHYRQKMGRNGKPTAKGRRMFLHLLALLREG